MLLIAWQPLFLEAVMKATSKRGARSEPVAEPTPKPLILSRGGRPPLRPGVRVRTSANLTVPMWPELRAALRQAAFDSDMSLSEFVRSAIIADLTRAGYLKGHARSK
jgi:hypothetical protein